MTRDLPPSFSEPEDDLVARRIVMRRSVWDELVKIADALKAARGIDVSPCDVAVTVLEAGLAECWADAPKRKKRKK